MKMMIVCLIYASCAASVLFLLLKPAPNLWKYYSLLLVFFVLSSYIKIKAESFAAITIIIHIFFIYAIAFIMRGVFRKTLRFATKIVCCNMAIACVGDLIAFLVIRYILQYKNLPTWEEPGGMEAIIISNVSQVIIAAVYSGLSGDKKQKQEEDNFFIANIIFTQMLVLLWCMIFIRMRLQNLPYMVYVFIAFQIILGILLCYWINQVWKYNDIREKKEKIILLKKENDATYEYYNKMGQSYKELHKLHHDFNNLMSTACFVAQEGDYAKAEQLFFDIECLLNQSKTSAEERILK